MHNIGVGEKKPISIGGAGALPDGVVFAYPAGRQSGGFEEAELGMLAHQFLDNRGGTVRGLVAHYNDFRDFRLPG